MTITMPAPASTGYTLVDADPNEIDITANVRTGVDITAAPEFIASITELGVRQAVLAVRRADGTLAVHDGQRRVFPRKWLCCVGACWRQACAGS